MEVDVEFTKEIIELGGSDVKKCFQCATCSVVCPISPEEKPFPRKEMIWSQWGLKEKLLKDPDVWLCHQCNDCSDYCPRGAKPGEVLAALRARQVQEYTFPSFLAKILAKPAGLIVYFAIPIILTLIYFAAFNPKIPEGEIIIGEFIPHTHVEYAGFAVGAWVIIVALSSLWRYWNGVIMENVPEHGEGAARGFFDGLIMAIKDILYHTKFKECGKANYRYYAHLMIFWGFIILGIATIGDIVYIYGLGVEELALPIWDPVKILGNIGAFLLFAGSAWAITQRLSDEKIGAGNYFDWLFLLTIFGIAVTGIAIELLRYAGNVGAYYAYIVHLILVFALLAFAPYTKFAHLLYRTLAYIWAKNVGREVKR